MNFHASNLAQVEFLADVIVTAVEGGFSTGWFEYSEYEWEDISLGGNRNYAKVNVQEYEDESGKVTLITPAQIAAALIVILDGEVSLADEYISRIFLANRDNDAGHLDAIDCDAIMQVAVLGDVVYG